MFSFNSSSSRGAGWKNRYKGLWGYLLIRLEGCLPSRCLPLESNKFLEKPYKTMFGHFGGCNFFIFYTELLNLWMMNFNCKIKAAVWSFWFESILKLFGQTHMKIFLLSLLINLPVGSDKNLIQLSLTVKYITHFYLSPWKMQTKHVSESDSVAALTGLQNV